MVDVIKFYKLAGDHGYFGNFSPHPIKLKGKWWDTTEHYFQAQKFAGTIHEEKVRKQKGPKQAAAMGRDRTLPLRKDWESVKENVMYDAIKAKFLQYEDLKQLLLSTGDAKIVEDSPVDPYWGCGADGKGKNRLGFLLMKLREELRQ